MTASVVSDAVGPGDVASIEAFCGDCHAVPRPDRFEKSRWHEEVDQGFRLYRESRRRDLIPPDFDATLAYFRDAAPETIPIEPPRRRIDSRFTAHTLDWPLPGTISAVSSLHRIDDATDGRDFLLTDMWTGVVARMGPDLAAAAGPADLPPIRARELARVAHVSRATPADLDGDGRLDVLVADLGTHNPQTEREGNVWWIRGDCTLGADAGAAVCEPLRLGLSRVAEAQTIDYDGDGDADVLVGDFGLHFEGGTFLGLQNGLVGGVPDLTWRTLDSRPGTIVMPVCDVDGDGRIDLVSLVTQHYETIEVNLNRGDGVFETKTIHQTPDPAFGSSSLQMIDFDGDGDLDAVYTNGDTFDDTLAKPFHGIAWLENTGTFPFTPHHVAFMPGCYHAAAGDLDGDGDFDIAAVALLSGPETARYPAGTFDGVAWFEQIPDGTFRRHTLVQDRCEAATLAIVDWNNDGKPDLLVPPCNLGFQTATALTVFLNDGELLVSDDVVTATR